MQLWRFIKFVSGLTVVALIYIHMQMNIFSLAYDGKQKEDHILRLREQNGRVANNIFELKSADYLGRKLLQGNAGLKFCDQAHVVRVVSDKKGDGRQELASRQKTEANPLSRIFTWHFPSVAHAEEQAIIKPWERKHP